MLVKIPEAPDDLVQQLKLATGMATASKAFLAAARSHEPLLAQVEALTAEVQSLKERLERSNEVIGSARAAAVSLLGSVGPGRKAPASLKDLGDWFDSQASLDLHPKPAADWESFAEVVRDINDDGSLVKGRDPGSS
ncbi:hypothetical protein [Pseudomonas sp. Root401]|uniref:hypothetical protein n=1 Tax=Pseudomonas sp. Root401 TaxID=1736526 RepID=UPI00070C1B8E|nr:hypothetical protein [Pseudomonas sp. Root401]